MQCQSARPMPIHERVEGRFPLAAWPGECRDDVSPIDALRTAPSWLTSMVVHMLLLLVLALVTLPERASTSLPPIELSERAPEEIESLPDPPRPVEFDWLAAPKDTPVVPPRGDDVPAVDPIDPIVADLPRLDGGIFWDRAKRGDPLTGVPDGADDGIGGRKDHFKRDEDKPEGRAIAVALRWLAAHQLPDGGWSFDHRLAPGCQGRCRHAGDLDEARIAATSLALLPMLGIGQTHQQGVYRENVRRGLYFLTSRMKVGPQGGALNEPGGRMYSHGLASIALCEAYALTHDRSLYAPAQAAVAFTCHAQDPLGGGWRYEPRQPGDTSLFGWQLMALKSAHMAYLTVPPEAIRKAGVFLDGVQYESGSRYGYTDASAGSTATMSIGLLCRMYLGWRKDNPALERGVEWLARRGPSPGDMYHNYYATQVMLHWGGASWATWRRTIGKQLLDTQATDGHEAGSWHVTHHHGDRGGRLYTTAMAAMILEAEYRVLPITQQQSVEDDFPL